MKTVVVLAMVLAVILPMAANAPADSKLRACFMFEEIGVRYHFTDYAPSVGAFVGEARTNPEYPVYLKPLANGWFLFLDHVDQGWPPNCQDGDFSWVVGSGALGSWRSTENCQPQPANVVHVDANVACEHQICGNATDWLSQAPVTTAMIELVDNQTGLSFNPPIAGTPDGGGYVFLIPPPGVYEVAVKFSASNYLETYQYNFVVDGCQKVQTFFGVSKTTATLLAGILGTTVDLSKGQLLGEVNGGVVADPVGCAVVDMIPNSYEGIYYFTDSGLPTDNRTDTNPANGTFFALNAEPRDHTQGGYEVVATASDGVTQLTEELPAVFAISFHILDLLFENKPVGCP
jgi:hypothetical protein